MFGCIKPALTKDFTDLITVTDSIKNAPQEIVQAQVVAYNSGNLDDFLSFYHQEVQIFDLPSGRLLISGHSKMREVYQKLFIENPSQNCRIVNRSQAGHFVVDLEQITGRSNQIDFQAVVIYEVKDNLINRVWFIRDK